jgi:hypothetical protein
MKINAFGACSTGSNAGKTGAGAFMPQRGVSVGS